jgi:hypothetical protein
MTVRLKNPWRDLNTPSVPPPAATLSEQALERVVFPAQRSNALLEVHFDPPGTAAPTPKPRHGGMDRVA